jgi:hypothetical protein
MKNRISFMSLFTAILISVIAGTAIGSSLNVSPLAVSGGLFALSFIPQPSGVSFMAIAKQIWVDQIMEGFYPADSFMVQSRDLSSLVEFNKINLAEAGVTPNVLVDNNSYPVATASREDTPLELALKTLDTENTVVRNVEEMESAYNKMESVIYGHRMALRTKSAQLAAWNWAPGQSADFNPVLLAQSTEYNAKGYKKLTFQDILDLEAEFDLLEVPEDGRTILLHPVHKKDLMGEDLKLYKQILADKKVFSFNLFVSTLTPLFTAAGVKQAFGSAKTSTSAISTIAWHKDEVMRADGTTEPFVKYKDPEQRGDVIGFQKRFVALPFRSKYMGAIYSTVKPIA